jgi:hypothetical protein
MKLRPVVDALILSILLGSVVLGCGKYGPPVRVYDRQAPATTQASDADEADDESEPEPSQP